jgi:hypothetical protein
MDEAKNIFIAERLNDDGPHLMVNVSNWKFKVLETLKGNLKQDQILNIYCLGGSVKGGIYLIISESSPTAPDKLDAYSISSPAASGRLDAYSLQPGIIPIWGNDYGNGESYLKILLKHLAPLSLEEKLDYLVSCRVAEIKRRQSALQDESEMLKLILPK